MVNEVQIQFSDEESIPNLLFQWVFGLFYDVKKSLASISYDHQMAINSNAYRWRNSILKN